MKLLFNLFIGLLISLQLAIVGWAIVHTDETLPAKEQLHHIAFLNHQDAWIDTTLKYMSTDEKIGQILCLAGQTTLSNLQNHLNQIALGGVVLDSLLIDSQIVWDKQLNAKQKIPLLLSSRQIIYQSPTYQYPKPVTLCAAGDSQAVYYCLSALAKEQALCGQQLTFGLELVLNTPENLHFSNDSWGETPKEAAKQAIKLINHSTQNGILLCAYDFSDYQNFEQDSLNRHKKILEQYRLLSQGGLPCLLIDPELSFENIPKHLQKKNHLKHYLTQYVGFEGLIISPLLKKENTPDSALWQSLHMGSDIILCRDSVSWAFHLIRHWVDAGQITESELNNRVRKILQAKSWSQQYKNNSITSEDILQQVYHSEKRYFIRRCIESSLTLLRNAHNKLPIKQLYRRRLHAHVIARQTMPHFGNFLNHYTPVPVSFQHYLPKDSLTPLNIRSLRYKEPLILVCDNIHLTDADSLFIKSLQKLDSLTNIIVINFGNPYWLKQINFIETIVHVPENSSSGQDLAAQMLMGALAPQGRLAQHISDSLSQDMSLTFKPLGRLKYTLPEEVGICSDSLAAIDSIIAEGINEHAFPGCQLMAGRYGKIFIHQNYGYHSYAKQQPVVYSDLYDLASVTKIASTTLAAMRLYEQEKIHLEDSIKHYLDDSIGSTIHDIQIRELLIHRSGLQADMPIARYIKYRDSLTGRFDKYYGSRKDTAFTLEVAEEFYLRHDYLDSIWETIRTLEIDSLKPYVYSDVNMNILYRIICQITEKPIDEYVTQNFYAPLGLSRICFHPLKYFDKHQITPTENCKFWRKQVLQGYVHDPAAALYGGVAGSAGLFATACDLAAVVQMLLNKGYYGGVSYFEPETIELFTGKQEDCHRGLGFNRSSMGGWGHTGFTGNYVWANPDNGELYIFLSNRVHPDMFNRKLLEGEYSARIRAAIQGAYGSYPPQPLLAKTETHAQQRHPTPD